MESASRMDYDRSKWMRASAAELVDPDKADAEFMRCLLQLLRKVRLQLPLARAQSPLQHAGLHHRETSRQECCGRYWTGVNILIITAAMRCGCSVLQGHFMQHYLDSQSDGQNGAIPWKATSSAGAPSLHGSDGGEPASSSHTAALCAICHTGFSMHLHPGGVTDFERRLKELPHTQHLGFGSKSEQVSGCVIDVSPSENDDLTKYTLHAQAHFAQLNDRDEAMSRSLNSDYLDQLLIRADTSRLDARLVAHAVLDQPLPEEEQALLVFKRGCGPGQGKWKQRAYSFHTPSFHQLFFDREPC